MVPETSPVERCQLRFDVSWGGSRRRDIEWPVRRTDRARRSVSTRMNRTRYNEDEDLGEEEEEEEGEEEEESEDNLDEQSMQTSLNSVRSNKHLYAPILTSFHRPILL